MAPPDRRWIAPAAGLVLVLHAALAVRAALALAGSGGPEGAPAAGALAGGLLGLLALAAVGRVALSLFPSGPIGSHAPRDLPATWAASHLVGLALLPVQVALLERLGVASAWTVWGPWSVLLVARAATLPGALVPGREPWSAPVPRAATGLRAALVVWAAGLVVCGYGAWEREAVGGAVPSLAAPLLEELGGWTFGSGAEAAHAGVGLGRLLVPASWLAAWFLLADGLSRARRRPLGSRAVVLAGALSVVYVPDATLAPVWLGAGLALSVDWLRRADARALGLSSVAYAAAAVWGQPLLGLAGVAATVLAGRAGQRREALRAGAIALVAIGVAGVVLGQEAVGADARALAPGASSPVALELSVRLGLSALALVGLVELRRRGAPGLAPGGAVRAEPGSPPASALPERPWAELRAACWLLALAAPLTGPWWPSFAPPTTALALLPLATLAAGLLAARPERPPA